MLRDDLPVLFVDHDFPGAYADLVEGRAVMVGPTDAAMADAEGVIAGAKRPWDAAAFTLGPKLRVISRTGIGYDNVDVAAATAAGVIVCNAPEAPSVSTAEHTLALMFAIGRDLPAQQARAREGLAGPTVGSSLEFDGRTLGLVGYGRIARRVGAVARALGMRVLAHDPYVAPVADQECEMVSFEQVLAEADVLSLHAPATPETHHLLNSQSLAVMRSGAYVVNCARGALIDQDALLAALNNGHLAGAALDVTDPEPLLAGHPLLLHPRVIVTPHIASSTTAGRRRLYEHALANALNVLAGRPATIVAPPP